MTGDDDIRRDLRLTAGDVSVECRWYRPDGARTAVVMVGGAGGGWDTPAKGLYPALARDLFEQQLGALRVRFRDSHSLESSVYDVAMGLALLRQEGIERAALVGHSFGGAVVIRAALLDPMVHAVVTLATQSYGTEGVEDLAPRCALLLVHGSEDPVLPAEASRHVYERAREPKRLVVLDGVRHNLDEDADRVRELTHAFILEQLATLRRE